MVTSCTYVASAEWIEQAVVFGSLTVAIIGIGILMILRDRRLKAEHDGEAAEPEALMA